MLEYQARFAVRLPWSMSDALPLNEADEEVRLAPLPGLLIDTTGGVFGLGPTVTVTVAEPALPAESVTRAIMLCVPLLSAFWKLPPLPICPSRSEVQTRVAVKLPSSWSEAEPEKRIAAP